MTALPQTFPHPKISEDEKLVANFGKILRFSDFLAEAAIRTPEDKARTLAKFHGAPVGKAEACPRCGGGRHHFAESGLCLTCHYQREAFLEEAGHTLEEVEAEAKERASKDVPALLQNFPVLSVEELQERHPNPPKNVIDGIIGEGEKLILAGASKAGKTYCLLNLAGAMASGGKWLGFQCRKGPALFLNFEVSAPRMAERNRHLGNAGVSMAGVDFLNLRGAQFNWPELIASLEFLSLQKPYALIILDPIYKLLGGVSENDNSEVASMLAEVERIAVETGAAVAFAHHFSKGNKAETASIDRVSGAGTFLRDPDAILTLTDHEEPHCLTCETTVRNYTKPAPVVVEYNFPRYAIREELDSARLKQARVGGHNKKGGAATVAEVLAIGGPMTSAELQQALADRARATDRTARRWMKQALDSGHAEEVQGLWKATEK